MAIRTYLSRLVKIFISSAVMFISSQTHASNIPTIELRSRNTLIFDSEINPVTVDTFMASIVGKRMMLPDKETLFLLIVSPGGRYDSALIMQKILSKIPNTAVICKYCASAAGWIFATAPGPRLVIAKSSLMMHEMYLSHATAHMVINTIAMINFENESDDFNKALYSRIGMSKEAYEKKILNTEWTLDGEDIVKFHLADGLIKIHCDPYMASLAPETCKPE